MSKEKTTSHAPQDTVGKERARAWVHTEKLGGVAGGLKGLGWTCKTGLECLGERAKDPLVADKDGKRNPSLFPVVYPLDGVVQSLGQLCRAAKAFYKFL